MTSQLRPKLSIIRTPVSTTTNQLRRFKYVHQLPGLYSIPKPNHIKQLKFIKDLTSNLNLDAASPQERTATMMAIKNCRRFIITGFDNISGASKRKIALMFPNSYEENVVVQYFEDWKRLLRRLNAKKLTFLIDPTEIEDDKIQLSLTDSLIPNIESVITRLKKQWIKKKSVRVVKVEGELSETFLDTIEKVSSLIPYMPNIKDISLSVFDYDYNWTQEVKDLDIFRYVKRISHTSYSSNKFLKYIVSNSNSFSALERLAIRISYDWFMFQNLTFIASLEKLEDLKHLELDADLHPDYLWFFFQEISFPKKLETLYFNIQCQTWDSLFNQQKDNPYEEDGQFKKFLKQWASLTSLKKLRFEFNTTCSHKPTQLLLSIIKRLKTLQELQIDCFTTPRHEEDQEEAEQPEANEQNIDSLAFGEILNGLAISSLPLKVIKVNAPFISMENYDNKICLKSFKLKNLSLDGVMLGPASLKSLLHLIENQTDAWNNITMKIRGKSEYEAALKSICKGCKLFRSDIEIVCEEIKKDEFVKITKNFVQSLDKKYNVDLYVTTSLTFEEEDLKQIGDLLKKENLLKSYYLRGENITLDFQRKMRSFTIE